MTNARVRLERGARLLAVVLLAWLAWSALRPTARARSARAAIGDVAKRARGWARDRELASLHLDVAATPAPRDLDFLVALRRAGVSVTWSGAIEPLGMTVERVPDPVATTRVSVTASPGGWLRLSDRLGSLDSVRPARGGAELVAQDVQAPVSVASGRFIAYAADPDSLVLRPVLVMGSAGWESKFVVAALEERGWRVASHIAVAPGARVEQGTSAPIDTARYSAVVALDTSAAPWAGAIARYVRSGGGLVLAGRSAAIPALAALAPSTLGAHRAARPALVADSVTPRALARWALAAPRSNSTTLARYGSDLAVVARVTGAGRVLQTGSEESWRWRMEGVEGSASAHREWWSRAVGAVAYAPAVALDARVRTLSAPRAQIADALGPPGDVARATNPFDPLRSPFVITAVIALLLAEWTSRRLRGAK